MKEAVTRNDIKILLAVITIVLAVAFAWNDLKHATKNAAETAKTAKEKTEQMAEKQDKMALDIVEIKTILKQRGLTKDTYTPVVRPLTIAEPTPAAQSAQLNPTPQLIVNNYVQPTQAPQPTPTSAPEATPTPTPTPNTILCVIGICL